MGFALLYPSYGCAASRVGGAVCNNARDRTPGARRMSRYLLYVACLALTLFSAWMSLRSPHWYWPLGIFGALSLLGTWDMLQTRTTLRRNYPILAHLRYLLESIGPEIRQYFIQNDRQEVPFSRRQRALVYQRAQNVVDVVPFGTEHDVYGPSYEWINHSLLPTAIPSHDFRVRVGPDTAQPYDASVFNISAMSFGSLSANAIRALNAGAKRGNFYHDTGEGSKIGRAPSELQSLMRHSYAVFCLNKKNPSTQIKILHQLL